MYCIALCNIVHFYAMNIESLLKSTTVNMIIDIKTFCNLFWKHFWIDRVLEWASLTIWKFLVLLHRLPQCSAWQTFFRPLLQLRLQLPSPPAICIFRRGLDHCSTSMRWHPVRSTWACHFLASSSIFGISQICFCLWIGISPQSSTWVCVPHFTFCCFWFIIIHWFLQHSSVDKR